MSIFALKITAAVLMLLDHIGFYFQAAPVWLRWLGRGAYPLFLFCMRTLGTAGDTFCGCTL